MSNLTAFVDVISNGTSFNGTTAPVAGITGTFGSPEIIGIAGILIILIIGMKMRASPDLILISAVCMLEILTGSLAELYLLPIWIEWVFIFIGGVVFSLGLIKVIKHR